MNTPETRTPERRVGTKRLGLPGFRVMLTCVCLVCCLGCGYPEVSPKAYQISKALYSVCNMKREGDLNKVMDAISKATADSELNDDEAEWLLAIVEKARTGEWDSAAQDARSILKDQIDL